MKSSGSTRFTRFLQAHPKTVAVLVGCGIALLLLSLLEVGSRLGIVSRFWKPAQRTSTIEGDYTTTGFFQYDRNLGYRPKPGVRVSSVRKYQDGEVVYNVAYTTDAFGRRVVPWLSAGNRQQFIAFFGCSYTFGEGLNDDETLPYFVAKLAPCYKPYNYAFSGYGPQQMLARLEEGSLPQEMHEKTGIGLCVSADVNRAIGSMYVFNAWGKDFPYYLIDDQGTLVRDGSFKTGRPFLSLYYAFLGKSSLAKVLNIRHPSEVTTEHIMLTARIIEQARKLFRSTFGTDRFYYVNLPGSTGSMYTTLVQTLRSLGVTCLDYGAREKFEGKTYHIQGDGHPTAKYNRELAELIVSDLGIEGATCGNVNGQPESTRMNHQDTAVSRPRGELLPFLVQKGNTPAKLKQ